MPGADIKRGLQARSGEEVADVDLPFFWLEAKHHHKTKHKKYCRYLMDCL